MRTLIAGNWKMHGLKAQLVEIDAMARSIREKQGGIDVLVCVPTTLIAGAVRVANGLIQIGGENCSAEEAGSFAGDIDAEMLRDAGATSVILGHSERRQKHHENDAMVAAKAKAAWQHGLATIICIGETEAQRRAGDQLKVCGDQLAASLPDMPNDARTSIAYEPLWAIGSGTMPTGDEIVELSSAARRLQNTSCAQRRKLANPKELCMSRRRRLKPLVTPSRMAARAKSTVSRRAFGRGIAALLAAKLSIIW